MNRRITFPYMLLLGCSSIMLQVQTETFEFLNKTNIPVQLVIGSKENPPKETSFTIVVQPGTKYSQSIDNSQGPQLLLIFTNPNISLWYALSPGKGKKSYVRIIDDKGIKFEPQTFVLNNLSKSNITLLKTSRPETPSKSASQPQNLALMAKMANDKKLAAEAKVQYDAKNKLPPATPRPNIPAKIVPPSPARIPTAPPLTSPAENVPQAPPLTIAIPQTPALVVPMAPPLSIVSAVQQSAPSDRDALLQQIQKGQQLKPIPAAAPSQQPDDGRQQLLQQIKAGKMLKKVSAADAATQEIEKEIKSLTPEQRAQLITLATDFGKSETEIAQQIKSIQSKLQPGKSGKAFSSIKLGDINLNSDQLRQLITIQEKTKKTVANNEEWD